MPGRSISEIQQMNRERRNGGVNHGGTMIDVMENDGGDDDNECLVET